MSRGLTPAGLPRPRNEAGLPIPWNSDSADLGQRHEQRTRRTAGGWICQVCGLRIEDDAAVLFVNASAAGGPSTLEPGESLPDDWGVHAMDHGLLHRRPCASLALAHCPALKKLAHQGALVAFLVPPGSIEAFGPDATAVSLDDLRDG